MRVSYLLPLLLTVLAVCVGCSHKDDHDHGQKESHANDGGHGQDHGAASPSGASFKPGKGIMLTEETRKILGVEVVDVTEGKLPTQIRLTVQVFAEKHRHGL